jgi:hypothetical protein
MATMQETTIPADYLEDVRSALVLEIVNGNDALRDDQERLVSERSAMARDDRACAMRLLGSDVRLLDELLGSSGDTKVTAERDTITEALQATVRVLGSRLVEQLEYAPIEMGAVLDLAGRLRWAAEEAARLNPALGGDVA